MTLRLSASGQADQSVRLLERLRAGASVADIRPTSAGLWGEVRDAAEALLAGIRRETGRAAESSPAVLALLDRALSTAWRADHAPDQHALLRALAGLGLAQLGPPPAWGPAP